MVIAFELARRVVDPKGRRAGAVELARRSANGCVSGRAIGRDHLVILPTRLMSSWYIESAMAPPLFAAA